MKLETVIQNGAAPEEGLMIRNEVFVEEQGVSPEIEYDCLDGDAAHVLVYADGAAAGYGRVVFEEAAARFTRIAVRKPYRMLGVGRAVVDAMLRCAAEKQVRRIYLHSQLSATEFYKKLGFLEYGEVFEEAGISHVSMLYTEV